MMFSPPEYSQSYSMRHDLANAAIPQQGEPQQGEPQPNGLQHCEPQQCEPQRGEPQPSGPPGCQTYGHELHER
jgi:hypothetical protein